jgi:mRNA-degrading endonuclease toxin of MazEF toxin-antitoxin module
MPEEDIKNIKVFNNYIYWVHFGNNIGSEQSLDRPALVVRSTKESPVCIVLPITLERLNDNIPYHIDLSNGKGTVLVEQIRTIDKQRIFDYVYHEHHYATLNDDDYQSINEQLEYMCRLKPLFKKMFKKIVKKY